MEDYKGHGMYQRSHLWKKESALCATAAGFVIYVNRRFPMASLSNYKLWREGTLITGLQVSPTSTHM